MTPLLTGTGAHSGAALGLHHWTIADLSTGRTMRANERIAFRAAARDEWVARKIEVVITRRASPLRLLDPLVNARTLRYGLRPGG